MWVALHTHLVRLHLCGGLISNTNAAERRVRARRLRLRRPRCRTPVVVPGGKVWGVEVARCLRRRCLLTIMLRLYAMIDRGGRDSERYRLRCRARACLNRRAAARYALRHTFSAYPFLCRLPAGGCCRFCRYLVALRAGLKMLYLSCQSVDGLRPPRARR